MDLSSVSNVLYENILATKWQEWLSTFFQIASVWYAKKNDVKVYPAGIVGVLLAAYLYFFMAKPPLYADGILNIYYFFMSIYGWYNWSLKKNEIEVYPISSCNTNELIMGLLIFVIGWVILYFLLINLTDSNTPVLDALVSASAVTSMWWMAKRKIENWLAWIASNIVAIPLNFYKGFMLFTLMYVLFLGLAILGYSEWKKQMKRSLHQHNIA
jgi:nicotinamide mononucleotide transporter